MTNIDSRTLNIAALVATVNAAETDFIVQEAGAIIGVLAPVRSSPLQSMGVTGSAPHPHFQRLCYYLLRQLVFYGQVYSSSY